MKRLTLNLLTVLSLLMFIVVAGLWVRSHFANDRLNLGPREGGGDVDRFRHYFARSGKGGFSFWVWGRDQPHGADYGLTWSHERAYWYPIQTSIRDARGMTAWNHAGFELRDTPASLMVTAPYWSVAPPLLALPAVRVARRVRRRRRFRTGHCPTCGYDLRATPDRCPECGPAASVTNSG